MTTSAVFFPFDLFGSGGAGGGAQLVADAVREMIADNKAERIPTRARAYDGKVRIREFNFETMPEYHEWRAKARQTARRALTRNEFLLWVGGNHLGVLPVYDELSGKADDTVVIQFDAHLDVYNLSDCTSELSHGNFLLHTSERLPMIVNVGSRELLLTREYVAQYYQAVFPAAEVAIDPVPALEHVRTVCRQARRVFLDIDCDVFDPAYFPALSHPMPFGLSPAALLRFVEAAWSENVIGVALSEFDPSRDHKDQSLSTLIWLIEYLLLKRYEPGSKNEQATAD